MSFRQTTAVLSALGLVAAFAASGWASRAHSRVRVDCPSDPGLQARIQNELLAADFLLDADNASGPSQPADARVSCRQRDILIRVRTGDERVVPRSGTVSVDALRVVEHIRGLLIATAARPQAADSGSLDSAPSTRDADSRNPPSDAGRSTSEDSSAISPSVDGGAPARLGAPSVGPAASTPSTTGSPPSIPPAAPPSAGGLTLLFALGPTSGGGTVGASADIFGGWQRGSLSIGLALRAPLAASQVSDAEGVANLRFLAASPRASYTLYMGSWGLGVGLGVWIGRLGVEGVATAPAVGHDAPTWAVVPYANLQLTHRLSERIRVGLFPEIGLAPSAPEIRFAERTVLLWGRPSWALPAGISVTGI